MKLFYRDKQKGLILTDAGQKILLLARQMQDIESRMYQTAFCENNFLGGRIRIASMPILTSVILSKVFHDYKEKYPYVTVELIEGSATEICKAVAEYRADFGFTASPFGGLDNEVLFKDRMVALGSHPFDPQDTISLYENPQRFIFCRAGHETTMSELRSRDVNFEQSFLVQQAETVISMVMQDNGIGIISDLVLTAVPHALYTAPIDPEIFLDIGLVAISLEDLTPVAAEFKRMIQEEVHRQSSFLYGVPTE